MPQDIVKLGITYAQEAVGQKMRRHSFGVHVLSESTIEVMKLDPPVPMTCLDLNPNFDLSMWNQSGRGAQGRERRKRGFGSQWAGQLRYQWNWVGVTQLVRLYDRKVARRGLIESLMYRDGRHAGSADHRGRS